MMQTIGERIREIRITQGLSIREVGRRTDFDYHTISDVENGRHFPNAMLTIALAELFGVTTDYILTGKEREKNE